MKSERIDLRIPAEARQTIEKAAMISGQSLSDFVVAATTNRAREVIRQSAALSLSTRDHARVMAALDAPPEPSEVLKRAARGSRKILGRMAMPGWEVERLADSHDRSTYAYGHSSLDAWLRSPTNQSLFDMPPISK